MGLRVRVRAGAEAMVNLQGQARVRVGVNRFWNVLEMKLGLVLEAVSGLGLGLPVRVLAGQRACELLPESVGRRFGLGAIARVTISLGDIARVRISVRVGGNARLRLRA